MVALCSALSVMQAALFQRLSLARYKESGYRPIGSLERNFQCARWYCEYGISYRDCEEMMEERGLDVDHATLYRWVQRYAPVMEKQLQ